MCAKAGESRGRAPGQASDYALRAPNPLGSSPMTRCFIKISGPQTSLGPRYFVPPAPPLAGLDMCYEKVTLSLIITSFFDDPSPSFKYSLSHIQLFLMAYHACREYFLIFLPLRFSLRLQISRFHRAFSCQPQTAILWSPA